MYALLAILFIVLLIVVVVQIAKLSELVTGKGKDFVTDSSNSWSARLMLIFLVGLFVLGFGSALFYKKHFLGLGANTAASAHGSAIDGLIYTTFFFTGVVFVITHILLFWFAYKYQRREGQKAAFISHDNRVEVIWTVIPAVVMTFLVVQGLTVWNQTTADVPASAIPGEDYIQVEATGYQFAWELRHPGIDEVLGRKNYKLIDLATNSLGLDFKDKFAADDFLVPDTLYLPVNKEVRVRINSKDVLHNFYLPQFRVKMDAVPGMPTYFRFTPIETTEARRARLGAMKNADNPSEGAMYPDWHLPADPTEPDGAKKYENFTYELACAELCGNGHYSMRRVIKIVEEDEYYAWIASKTAAKDGESQISKSFQYFKNKIKDKALLASLFTKNKEALLKKDKSLASIALELGVLKEEDLSTYSLDPTSFKSVNLGKIGTPGFLKNWIGENASTGTITQGTQSAQTTTTVITTGTTAPTSVKVTEAAKAVETKTGEIKKSDTGKDTDKKSLLDNDAKGSKGRIPGAH